MGARIDNLRQAIRYGSDTERIWARLIAEGVDVTSPTGDVTIQFYDVNGTAIGSAVTMTQYGDPATAWHYYDLDASGTTTWPKGYGYRGEVTFVSGGLTYKQDLFLDVVVRPINEPLISSEQIDTLHPSWADERHEDLTDWSDPIKQAHLELIEDLRTITDNRGNKIYVNRVLNRNTLARVERAYVEDIIAREYVGETEERQTYFAAKRQQAIDALNNLTIDFDDDLVEDSDEEIVLSITMDH